MFMGKYNNCIDAKSRMIVPAKFREQLGDKCVVTKGADMCLVIFSTTGWEDFIESLMSLGMTPSERRSVLRHFSANAVEDEIDKQGRILLPAELMEFANISKDLITVGSVDKIEVWSREEWENKENKTNLTHIEVSNIIDKYDENGRCSF